MPTLNEIGLFNVGLKNCPGRKGRDEFYSVAHPIVLQRWRFRVLK